MNYIVHSPTGLVHLISSVLAVLFGSLILIRSKGTKGHKRIGYVYVACMSILLFTSFMMYGLFGGFGIFHVASIISTITLILGMYPAITRRNSRWPLQHLSWMYWSVIGLYAALASEIFTRFLPHQFFSGVGIATGIIMILGAMGFRKNLKNWKNKFHPTG